MTRALLSVAICTAERPADLQRTLDSLARQDAAEKMDVLVVDNSASGSAKSVWQAFTTDFAGEARYLHVAEPGLSRARNGALEDATSEFVAFLDDDVTLPPAWYTTLARAVAVPGTVAAGGPIRLAWEGSRPRWLHREYDTFFSALDLGDVARDFSIPRETPYGANFAVHRELTLDVGGFDPRLGRTGKALVGGEEVDVILRLAPKGAVRYVPEAWINHHIQAARATRRWLLRRCWAQGKTEALITVDPSFASPSAVSRRDTEKASLRAKLPYAVARHLGAYAASLERRAAVLRGAG